MNLKEACSAVRQTIEKYSQEISAVGEHVWKNPEPGYREVETSAYLAKKNRRTRFERHDRFSCNRFPG